jgi:GH15 family glucan-1,4-alpha-glucosidase
MWDALRILHKIEVTQEDLAKVEKTLDWVTSHMYASGVLAEQLDPYSGESLSATPLVWSHAVYVDLVIEYLKAREGQLQDMLKPAVL